MSPTPEELAREAKQRDQAARIESGDRARGEVRDQPEPSKEALAGQTDVPPHMRVPDEMLPQSNAQPEVSKASPFRQYRAEYMDPHDRRVRNVTVLRRVVDGDAGYNAAVPQVIVEYDEGGAGEFAVPAHAVQEGGTPSPAATPGGAAKPPGV